MVKVGLDEEGKKGRRKMKEEDEGKEGEKDGDSDTRARSQGPRLAVKGMSAAWE